MDKISLSELREHKAIQEEEKNPNAKLRRLINEFHSIDNVDYLNEQEKQQRKNKKYKEIMQFVEKANSSAKGKIQILLYDKEKWEKERDNFY